MLLGNGDGTFQPAASFAGGGAPTSVVAADLDGDGFRDLASADGGNVSVFFNLPEPEGWMMIATGAALLRVLHRRRVRELRLG